MKLQPSLLGSVTAAIPRLSSGFPGLGQLQLSDVSLGFTHLQALSQLRCLQHLQLHNVECKRGTFTRLSPWTSQQSVFAHLVQLTELEIWHKPSLQIRTANRTRYLTGDLHGLSHLTNLKSLTVATRTSRPQCTSRRPAFYSAGPPVVPAHKLATLSHLTALHVNVLPTHLVTLSQLQVLDLAQIALQRLPANMSALKSLSQLTISGVVLPPSELASLSSIPALKRLALNRVPVRLLRPLETLTALQRLGLVGLTVDCQSSACLARMTHLTSLDLGVTIQDGLIPTEREILALHNLMPALTYLANLDLSVHSMRRVVYDKRVLGTGMYVERKVYHPLQQLLPDTELSSWGLAWPRHV